MRKGEGEGRKETEGCTEREKGKGRRGEKVSACLQSSGLLSCFQWGSPY